MWNADRGDAETSMLEAKITTHISMLDTQGVSRVLEGGLSATDTFKISNEEDAVFRTQDYQIATIPRHMSYPEKKK